MSSCPDSCSLLKSGTEAAEKNESIEDFLKCFAYNPFFFFFLTSVAPRSSFIFEKRIKAYEFEISHDVKSALTNVQIRNGKSLRSSTIILTVSFEQVKITQKFLHMHVPAS